MGRDMGACSFEEYCTETALKLMASKGPVLFLGFDNDYMKEDHINRAFHNVADKTPERQILAVIPRNVSCASIDDVAGYDSVRIVKLDRLPRSLSHRGYIFMRGLYLEWDSRRETIYAPERKESVIYRVPLEGWEAEKAGTFAKKTLAKLNLLNREYYDLLHPSRAFSSRYAPWTARFLSDLADELE